MRKLPILITLPSQLLNTINSSSLSISLALSSGFSYPSESRDELWKCTRNYFFPFTFRTRPKEWQKNCNNKKQFCFRWNSQTNSCTCRMRGVSCNFMQINRAYGMSLFQRIFFLLPFVSSHYDFKSWRWLICNSIARFFLCGGEIDFSCCDLY